MNDTPEAKLDAARALRAAADWAENPAPGAPSVSRRHLRGPGGSFCVLGYALHELEGPESPGLTRCDTAYAIRVLVAGEITAMGPLRYAFDANDQGMPLAAADRLRQAAQILEDAAFAGAQAEFERPCDGVDSYIDAHEAADKVPA